MSQAYSHLGNLHIRLPLIEDMFMLEHEGICYVGDEKQPPIDGGNRIPWFTLTPQSEFAHTGRISTPLRGMEWAAAYTSMRLLAGRSLPRIGAPHPSGGQIRVGRPLQKDGSSGVNQLNRCRNETSPNLVLPGRHGTVVPKQERPLVGADINDGGY